jgi:hypothetical protein
MLAEQDCEISLPECRLSRVSGRPAGSCRQPNRLRHVLITPSCRASCFYKGPSSQASITSRAGPTQAIESVLVRVHAGVADLRLKTRDILSSPRNEINQIPRGREFSSGSPHWTRFELLQRETGPARTNPTSFGPTAYAQDRRCIQTGWPHWIHLERIAAVWAFPGTVKSRCPKRSTIRGQMPDQQ